VSAGRDPSTIDRLVLTGPELDAGLESEEAFADRVGRFADIGFTDLVVHWPRASEPYAGDRDTFERAVSAFFAKPHLYRGGGSAKKEDL
jgi:hypothetical protein